MNLLFWQKPKTYKTLKVITIDIDGEVRFTIAQQHPNILLIKGICDWYEAAQDGTFIHSTCYMKKWRLQ